MGCSLSIQSPGHHHKMMNNKNSIRVVHFDGRIEDFDVPMKVGQIVQNPRQDVLCTKSQLLCQTSCKSLAADLELEFGNMYFLLPITAFRSEASVMDMANMVKQLTNKANKATGLKKCSRPVVASAGAGGDEGIRGRRCGSVARVSSSWKPVLDTIGEKSFTGRSESDLREC